MHNVVTHKTHEVRGEYSRLVTQVVMNFISNTYDSQITFFIWCNVTNLFCKFFFLISSFIK
jgi:hypothetical protein